MFQLLILYLFFLIPIEWCEAGTGKVFFLKKSISFLKENYSFIHPSFGENEGNVVVIIRFSLRYSDGILCVFESRVPFHISQPHIFLEHVYCLFN